MRNQQEHSRALGNLEGKVDQMDLKIEQRFVDMDKKIDLLLKQKSHNLQAFSTVGLWLGLFITYFTATFK